MDHPVAASVLHHLLLVEADRGFAEIICADLGQRADRRVHLLGDVVSAFRFLAKRDRFSDAPTPDLILLDLRLPYFAGTALLHERRRRPAWRAIPVVVVGDTEDDELNCRALGADGFLGRLEDPRRWLEKMNVVVTHHLPTAPVGP